MPGDAAALDREADEAAAGAVPGHALQRCAAHEIAGLVELDDPALAGLEGIRGPVELVAVERHAGLEAERVARPQAHRDHAAGPARVEERVPQLAGAAVLDEDLEAVLAGVARPRHERRDAGDVALRDGVVARAARSTSVSGRTISSERGPWTAMSAVASAPVVQDGPAAGDPLRQRVAHDLAVAGIGDDEVALLAQPIDDQVVEDAAVRRDDHRVVGTPDGEGRRVRDERVGQGVARLRAFDEQLAHVRQVEQAGPLADGAVLFEDAAVLDRHEPAR